MKQRVEHRFFNGVKYYRYPDAKTKTERRYFKRGRTYLHRVIWEHHNGPIPKGGHIHHNDEDTTNNEIDNLELVTPKEHASKHWTEERADLARAQLDKVRHLTVAWHRSKAGREWHRRHGLRTIEKVERLNYICERCGKKYKTTKKRTNRYCSNKCRAYARRARGDDDITKTCKVCSKEFVANRYAKAVTCGRKCGSVLRKKAS